MRKLLKNNHADLNMVLTAVVMAIGFAIALIIIWNVVASIDASTLDASIAEAHGYTAGTSNYENSTDVTNATEDLQTNLETFFTIGPIALIVVAAVGILSYVLLLRKT